jgi:hypothetical protein
VAAQMKQSKGCDELVFKPFPCICFLAVLPPVEEGIERLGAQVGRHVVALTVVVSDDFCSDFPFQCFTGHEKLCLPPGSEIRREIPARHSGSHR